MAEANRDAEAMYGGLYDGCLRTGKFPDRWKIARVVLMKKEDKPEGEASSYRPLCLLNEHGKVMERLIKNKIEECMTDGGEVLSTNQYEFRTGRSTIDAIIKVRETIENKLNKDLEVVAVSLDIKNAFNSIEWGEIKRAVKRKKLPVYIQKIIGDYLAHRRIVWIGGDGKRQYRKVERGVPQGSVLGPLLWNIVYDSVLRMTTPADCEIIYYADDTLIIAGGKCLEIAMNTTEILANTITRKIEWMGLQVAAEESVAVRFRRRGDIRRKGDYGIVIENTRIPIKHNM